MMQNRPGEFWVQRGKGTVEIFPDPLKAAEMVVEQKVEKLQQEVAELKALVQELVQVLRRDAGGSI